MNWIAKLFGVDIEQYNQWQVHWNAEYPLGIIILLVGLACLALWFFWTSLSRVDSRLKKVFFFTLRASVFS